MKDIIVFGCPRSGKTTLTKMLQKKLGYQVISLDSLVYTFEQNFSDIGITRNAMIREKSKKIMPFIEKYIKNYKLDYPEQNFIIEGCQILISDIIPILDRSRVDCVCLGYSNANVEDIFNEIRGNDSNMKLSYTKKLTDEELKNRIAIWIKLSEIFKEEAMKYSVPFYETGINRKTKLDIICAKIIDKVEEKEEEK